MTETYGGWETPGSGPTLQTDELSRRDGMRRELDRMHDEIARIESELDATGSYFPLARRVMLAADTLTGLALGFVGAAVSLLFQAVLSLLGGHHPLQVVRVFLTLPLGGSALTLESGPALAIGVCLYLIVGALYGRLFHAVLTGQFALAPGVWRLLAATAMGILLFVIHVYLLLGWAGPLWTGEPSAARLLPPWVAALTHVVFAWSILAFETSGRAARSRPREDEAWPSG
jgi:hypothetical protein